MIVSINNVDVTQYQKEFIKEMLRSPRRPMTVRFAKPAERGVPSLLSEMNPIPSKPWDDSDVGLRLPCQRVVLSAHSKIRLDVLPEARHFPLARRFFVEGSGVDADLRRGRAV